MAQQVEIPLDELNAIPGVSGVEPVTFDVPEVRDIETAVDDAVLSLDDVTAVVAEEVDRVVDDVIDGLEEEIPDVDVPGADVVADAVLDRLDVDQGLFGPIEEPLDAVIDQAVRDGLESLEGLDVDLGALGGDDLLDLPGVVDDVQADIQSVLDTLDRLEESVGDGPQLEFPNVEEIVANQLAEIEPAVDGEGFFTNPVGFGVALGRAAVEDAVDDETAQALSDAVE